MTQTLKTLIPLAIVFALLVATNVLFASWTAPAGIPSAANNAPAPINVSSVAQVKNGALGVDGLAVFGIASVQTEVRSPRYCDENGLNCLGSSSSTTSTSVASEIQSGVAPVTKNMLAEGPIVSSDTKGKFDVVFKTAFGSKPSVTINPKMHLVQGAAFPPKLYIWVDNVTNSGFTINWYKGGIGWVGELEGEDGIMWIATANTADTSIKNIVWTQKSSADQWKSCSQICSEAGMVLASDPAFNDSVCASGERQVPGTGISYIYGTWRNGIANQTFEVGRHCYAPGQHRDRDATDLTVGCSCGSY